MNVFRVTIVVVLWLLVSQAAEYKWYDVTINDVVSTYNYRMTYTYSADSNNNGFLLVSGAAAFSGCTGDTPSGGDLVTYINGDIVEQAVGQELLPWDKIRYTQQFWGGASCWWIFGEYGLIPFDNTIDTVISNNLIAGSWNGESKRCDNEEANFWHIYRGSGYKGSLRLEIRRQINVTDVGIDTWLGCASNPMFKYSVIQVGYDQNCEAKGLIKHLNWESLLNENDNTDDIPYSNISMYLNMNTLEMNFDIDLEYVGWSTDGNINNEYNLGTTYVIDFQSFNAHSDRINKPGNCQNRVESSFSNIGDFRQMWKYSNYPYDNLGTNVHLSYPPPSEYWTLSMEEFTCSTINYNGLFSWNDLTHCQDYDGNSLIDVADDGTSITLSGTMYVNVVSAWSMSATDSGHYRTFPLIQQDFSISLLKQINVLSSTGVELFITSIIGVFEDESDGSFQLSILTQSADYLSLTDPNVISTPFASASISSATSSCLVATSYTCGQIFIVHIDQSQFSCPPADFGGVYQLAFTATCPGNDEVCNTFIDDNGGSSVALEVTSNFVDRLCQPKIYQVIFEGNLKFYDDETYTTVHVETGHNDYIIGQSVIYVEAEVNFPDDGTGDNLQIFGVEIENVFVCTAHDNIDLTTDLNQQNGAGGCLSSNIDTDGPYDIITNGVANVAYEAHIFSNNLASNIVRFSFLTFDVGRTRIYIHTQSKLILKGGERRRLQVIESDLYTDSNQIRHFVDSTTISQPILSEKISTTITNEQETNSASTLSIWVYTAFTFIWMICL